jgi:hypothetical protein
MVHGHIQEVVQASIIRLQHNASCFHTPRQNPSQLNHGLLVISSDTKPDPEVYEEEFEHQHDKDDLKLKAQRYPY